MLSSFRRSISSLKYHKISDYTLESLVESLDLLGDQVNQLNYDVELSVFFYRSDSSLEY
jgi:frataxin-like iron-binding protein CyaY